MLALRIVISLIICTLIKADFAFRRAIFSLFIAIALKTARVVPGLFLGRKFKSDIAQFVVTAEKPSVSVYTSGIVKHRPVSGLHTVRA